MEVGAHDACGEDHMDVAVVDNFSRKQWRARRTYLLVHPSAINNNIPIGNTVVGEIDNRFSFKCILVLLSAIECNSNASRSSHIEHSISRSILGCHSHDKPRRLTCQAHTKVPSESILATAKSLLPSLRFFQVPSVSPAKMKPPSGTATAA